VRTKDNEANSFFSCFGAGHNLTLRRFTVLITAT